MSSTTAHRPRTVTPMRRLIVARALTAYWWLVP
jgi:hypothetical protein